MTRAGNTVVVSRNGEPIAELRPVSRRTFVPRQVIAGAGKTAAHVDYEQFRTDLDHVVDQAIARGLPLYTRKPSMRENSRKLLVKKRVASIERAWQYSEISTYRLRGSALGGIIGMISY